MQSASQNENQKSASLLALVISVILLAAKLWAFHLTGSVAVLSDALESVINVVAAAILVSVMIIAVKPPDEDHPYGHGKFEYFSAIIEGVLISLAALIIAYDVIKGFSAARVLQNLADGIYWVTGAALVNLFLGLYLRRVGKKSNSLALLSSSTHLLADFYTTAGVLVGLFLIHLTGLVWIDGAAALVVSLHLLWSGTNIVRQAMEGLTDKVDAVWLHQLQELIAQNPQEGMIQIHHVRIIRSGAFHHIDAHLVAPEYWTVLECHELTNSYAKRLAEGYGTPAEVVFHVDPCRRVYCQVCDVANCPVRQAEFKAREPVLLEELLAIQEPEKYQSSL